MLRRNPRLLRRPGHQATFDLVREELAVQVSADEDDLADTSLPFLPLRLGRAKINLFVHALEDEFLVALARKTQHALRPVEIRSPSLQQFRHEYVELGHVQEPFHGYATGRHHAQIVDLRRGRFFAVRLLEEDRIEINALLDVKRIDADDLLQVDLASLTFYHFREVVDLPYVFPYSREFVGRDQVDLVQQDLITESYLLDGLVDGACGVVS